MRMWMVDPSVLCRKHLLGEHVELHMFVGAIQKGTSLRGFVEKGLVNTSLIPARHEVLAAEMYRRGYSHRSPLLEFADPGVGDVDSAESLRELASRCSECAKRIQLKVSC